jgi:hypothetical protein
MRCLGKVEAASRRLSCGAKRRDAASTLMPAAGSRLASVSLRLAPEVGLVTRGNRSENAPAAVVRILLASLRLAPEVGLIA